jgi:outer membrane lipase/esterase
MASVAPVEAQQFTENMGFGDSYIDTGNAVSLLGPPYTTYYPTGRFSGGTNVLDTMSSLLGI